MPAYTYTIFDADPNSSSGTAWPSHSDIELEADSNSAAVDAVRDIMSSEAAGLSTDDGYEPGQLLHAIVWDADGTHAGNPTYELTHDDLGVTPPDESAAAAIAALEAVELGDGRYAYYAEETSSYWVVTRSDLEEWCEYPEHDRYSHWCAGCPGEEQERGWEP